VVLVVAPAVVVTATPVVAEVVADAPSCSSPEHETIRRIKEIERTMRRRGGRFAGTDIEQHLHGRRSGPTPGRNRNLISDFAGASASPHVDLIPTWSLFGGPPE